MAIQRFNASTMLDAGFSSSIKSSVSVMHTVFAVIDDLESHPNLPLVRFGFSPAMPSGDHGEGAPRLKATLGQTRVMQQRKLLRPSNLLTGWTMWRRSLLVLRRSWRADHLTL